jgi:hypothetical protein
MSWIVSDALQSLLAMSRLVCPSISSIYVMQCEAQVIVPSSLFFWRTGARWRPPLGRRNHHNRRFYLQLATHCCCMKIRVPVCLQSDRSFRQIYSSFLLILQFPWHFSPLMLKSTMGSSPLMLNPLWDGRHPCLITKMRKKTLVLSSASHGKPAGGVLWISCHAPLRTIRSARIYPRGYFYTCG